ncbi:hypothetical protein C8Q79DRAFT_746253 [Trametes meyenii]|nr:hypothetical protein C8Q79DRAFT_746253 [Trametes meyenii]
MPREGVHENDQGVISRALAPHLAYFHALQEGVDTLVGIPIYAICCPLDLWDSLKVNVPAGHHISWSLKRIGKQASVDAKESIKYNTIVALKIFSPPWRYPEALARLAHSRTKGSQVKTVPPPEGTVRVKWYPDLSSLRKWPEGFGDVWVDLPLESDGGLDLKPLRKMWGMENCYVLDVSPSRQPCIGRRPDEKLSALAWQVRMDGHSVLGVTECPTPTTQSARKARAFVNRTLNADLRQTAKAFLHVCTTLLSTAFWIAVTFLAIIVLACRYVPYAVIMPIWKTAALCLRVLRFVIFGVLAACLLLGYAVPREAYRVLTSAIGVCAKLTLTSGRNGLRWVVGELLAWSMALIEALFLNDAAESKREETPISDDQSLRATEDVSSVEEDFVLTDLEDCSDEEGIVEF